MNKYVLSLGLTILGIVCVTFNSPAQTSNGWCLVWSDEFSQTNGSSPDSSKWGYNIGNGSGGWGNNELEYYTSRTNNARIEDGQLVIEARQESYGGKSYTSARLLTKGKWSWTCGRIEARIKIPRGQGIWPAFWMLGTNIDSVSWPACGEIDLMENIGSRLSTVYGTIHGPGYSGGSSIGGSYVLPGGAAFADDFHLFAVEWETNRIRWYADNQLYFTVTPANLPGSSTWVFDHPQFLLLNVAVGGNWPGNPDGTTTFPQRMTVDYVRVYAATNTTTNVPACGGNQLVNPGFEIGGLANWPAYGDNTYLATSNSLPVHGGSNSFKVYGRFNGSENYSGVYCDVSTTAGSSYTAGGWAITPGNDRIAGDNSAWLEVSFRDVPGNIISLYRSSLITSNSPAGAWLNLAVTNQYNPTNYTMMGSVTNLVAPAETAFVRYQIVFRQPLSAAGAVLFDDLNLTAPSPIETPVLASAAKTGANRLDISFDTLSGLAYQVRYKSNLNDSSWHILTNLTGNGSTNTVTDTFSVQQRFYSVVRECN